MIPAPRTWLITGVSSGFGRCMVDEITQRGDFVIGTLRNAEQVNEFNQAYGGKAVAIQLDVNHNDQIKAGVAAALQIRPRIDVLVNNAGYGLFGAVEECSEAEVRAQMETNFFGALALTREVLPIMRAQRSGYIIQISSIAGICSNMGLGIYNASKFALEGFSEALSMEVAPLGIKVMLVEPGPFRTKWAGGGAKHAAQKIDDYAATAHMTVRMINGYDGKQPGDPVKAVRLMLEAMSAEKPPLRLLLGQAALERARTKIAQLQQDFSTWEKASLATAFDEGKAA